VSDAVFYALVNDQLNRPFIAGNHRSKVLN